MTDLLNTIKNCFDGSIKIWGDLGFLEGLTENETNEVVRLFNEMTVYLVEGEHSFKNEEAVEYLVYPILRRCVQHCGGVNELYSPEKLCSFIDIAQIPLTEAFQNIITEGDSKAESATLITNIFSNKPLWRE